MSADSKDTAGAVAMRPAGVMRAAMRGAVGGLVATGAMSVVMLLARRLGVVRKLAPEHITEQALDAAEVERSEETDKAAATAAHLAYGAGNGVIFALVGHRLPGPPLVKGVVFAAVLLVVSYQGWVPAARILPPLHAQTPGGRWTLVASHLVYGTTLAALHPQEGLIV